MRALWNSANDSYPPTAYRQTARALDVEILSITPVGRDRAPGTPPQASDLPLKVSRPGLFSATLLFEFRPEERRSIDEVWTNPFGFTVTEYAIRSDRLEN